MTSSSKYASVPYLRARMGKVCVAITGYTAPAMIGRAESVVSENSGENSFLEFRLDYLAKPLTALPKLKQFLAEHRGVTAVATCRRTEGGGKFAGSVTEELEILGKASASGFHLIDLELETAEKLTSTKLYPEELDKLRTHGAAALLVSSHDFSATKDLDGLLERIRRFEPEFIKIVSTAKTLADNMTMLHFLERSSDHVNLIGICMGEAGTISRILGPRSGSVFTFASASEGEETGPGQISVRTLSAEYRIDSLDAATRIYGVAGDPIRHSLSPLMLNAAFRREIVNAILLPLQARKLTDLLTVARELPLAGFAVTMPLKQEILPHLEKTDALSTKVGACNTVVRSAEGKLFGFNTDVGGVVRPLERRLTLKGARVLVLGAGGAARAAVFGLVDRGAEVLILNRTLEKAQKLAREAKAKVIKREQVAKSKFDVILNATPTGMGGAKQASILNPEELNARVVFDMVYNPVETPLIRAARARGIPVITGVEMFVQQGARQFEIWTGKPAPEEEMLRVVVHALRQGGEVGSRK